MNNYRPDKLSGGGLKALSLSLPGAHRGRPRPRHTATRSTRQPAYEAARLVLQQNQEPALSIHRTHHRRPPRGRGAPGLLPTPDFWQAPTCAHFPRCGPRPRPVRRPESRRREAGLQQRTFPREVEAAVSSPWPLVGLEAVRLLAFPFLKPREKPLVAASHTRTSSSPRSAVGRPKP